MTERTPDQIRAEIRHEREQLDAEVQQLTEDVKHKSRVAGSALAAVGGLAVVLKLFRRRSD